MSGSVQFILCGYEDGIGAYGSYDTELDALCAAWQVVDECRETDDDQYVWCIEKNERVPDETHVHVTRPGDQDGPGVAHFIITRLVNGRRE